MRGYLHVIKLLSKSSVNYTEVFESYCQCYSSFHRELLVNDLFDGMWIAPLLEYLAILLSKLAVMADSETEVKKNVEEEKKEYEKSLDDQNEDEVNKNMHTAL